MNNKIINIKNFWYSNWSL